MTETARRVKRPLGRRSGFLPRLTLVLSAGLFMVPLLTTSIAFQDMTSLLEGKRAEARWQSYFVPSPAGSIETATMGFAESATADRLPVGAGIRTVGGAVYTLDTKRPDFETPDEARVNRSQKSARVIASTPSAPPKAFSAGSILERQSLLRPADMGGKDLRLAFARPTSPKSDLVQLAMNFETRRDPILAPKPEARVMVASLQKAPPKNPLLEEASTPETTALGYAPAPSVQNPVAALFGAILHPGRKGFIPPIGKDDHAWAATPLPASAYSAKEQTCLANGIYFEARGESQAGQAAVAQVILNRVRNPTYPKTICGVVYQNQSWRNRCQFSFACDGIKDRITNKRAFSIARRIADEVTKGETWIAEVGSATHYHANYVKPRWASAMQKVDRIGQHIFYRTYGGGWN